MIRSTLAAGLAGMILPTATGMVFAARCTDYWSYEQAVRAWCSGAHPRADGDNDGIPCENVCPNRRIVNQIRAQIGC
ncbi:MAG: excalibur calcium-binding domain-containing protein [Roseitalea sp.]|jgi:hypothetical protein|nr:excalibur calcium-binding domain-containing protein [Roseitalea sp.]MBO6720563.1 excalibur calcium-binding domain-containing protein [Roseitalea sp.]MBO6743710.1 excalibur calcium-binding domain-containing protein [Roseitalea sp.]